MKTYYIDESHYTLTPHTGQYNNNNLCFKIQSKHSHVSCPMCRTETDKRQDLISRISKQPIDHYTIPQTNKKIVLFHDKRYMRCDKCGISFMEEFDILANSGRHTHIQESQIYALKGSQDIKQLSKTVGISARKLYKIIKHTEASTLNKIGKDLIETLPYIVINGYNRTNRNNTPEYVIYDSISQLTLYIGSRAKDIDIRYTSLSPIQKKKIQGITSSMSSHLQKIRQNLSIHTFPLITPDEVENMQRT